ncbi:TatD family hydrolase [Patescibacteria group bacterium]|nr:TatD family hydrolase [Patescibacteria group bacterium]
MLIDTHAHLNFEDYNIDREKVIKRCQIKEMAVINVGAQLETSMLAVRLAENHHNMYAAVGLHPIHVFDEEFDYYDFRAIINNKVVAVGETGFDYYHLTFNRGCAQELLTSEVIAEQKRVFLEHIRLAKEKDLALICHGRNGLEKRNAYNDILEILVAEKVERAVIHCFGGDVATAREIVKRGYYLGIDGPVTFTKKAEELQRVVKEMPLDHLLIETDCPFLAPEPHRGKRNEPIYVEYVAEKIAELKGISKAEVIEQTWQNAKYLFRL